jgi:hypothetical protein
MPAFSPTEPASAGPAAGEIRRQRNFPMRLPDSLTGYLP